MERLCLCKNTILKCGVQSVKEERHRARMNGRNRETIERKRKAEELKQDAHNRRHFDDIKNTKQRQKRELKTSTQEQREKSGRHTNRREGTIHGRNGEQEEKNKLKKRGEAR